MNRFLSKRVVAALWIALPFATLWWIASNTRRTVDPSDAITAIVVVAIASAAVVVAAIGLWRDKQWAQQVIAAMSVVLVVFSACMGVWISSMSGQRFLIMAVAGVLVGLYSIFSLARLKLSR